MLVNELAPRPHNSGHYTIEACDTSQFENHIRGVLGLPLGAMALRGPRGDGQPARHRTGRARPDLAAALAVPGAHVHLYGKAEVRPGPQDGACHRAGRDTPRRPWTTAAARPPWWGCEPGRPAAGGDRDGQRRDLPRAAPPTCSPSSASPTSCASCRRTASRTTWSTTRRAADRGLRVIVAGAGGAAHLPGMLAADTPLPVIGVPVRGAALDGLDALLSIVQMPRGVPVATVAIGGGRNAGLLAAQILALSDPALAHRDRGGARGDGRRRRGPPTRRSANRRV